MTTYIIIDQTTSEQFTFTMPDNHEVSDLMKKVEEMMYIHRECHPVQRFWTTRLLAGYVSRWSYHGLEFMEMRFHRESGTFTIWDVGA